MILVLIGKSGSGKSTVAKELNKLGITSIKPYTTRPQRDGEDNNYHFISREDFLNKKLNNFFAATSEHNGWCYGIAIEDISRNGDENKVLCTDPTILYQLRRRCLPIVAFYLKEDTTLLLKRLLYSREDDGDEIVRRLAKDEEDYKDINNLVDFTYNGIGKNLFPDNIARLILTQFTGFLKEKVNVC